MSEIEIRPLTPELAEAYVQFFDETPHDDNIDAHKCYCVCWCSANAAGVDFSSREKRRALALDYVRDGRLQGYLAYHNGRIVGWCNANTKADCLYCSSWRRFMGAVPTGEAERVKAVYCFVIAPAYRRRGIATRLLTRVCADAARAGFDCVEAYPSKGFAEPANEFMGPAEMYRKNGFMQVGEADSRQIMRKPLK